MQMKCTCGKEWVIREGMSYRLGCSACNASELPITPPVKVQCVTCKKVQVFKQSPMTFSCCGAPFGIILAQPGKVQKAAKVVKEAVRPLKQKPLKKKKG